MAARAVGAGSLLEQSGKSDAEKRIDALEVALAQERAVNAKLDASNEKVYCFVLLLYAKHTTRFQL